MRVRERGREPDDAHRVRLETAACPHRFSRTKVVSTGQFKTRTRARPPRGSPETLSISSQSPRHQSHPLSNWNETRVCRRRAPRVGAHLRDSAAIRVSRLTQKVVRFQIYIYIYISIWERSIRSRQKASTTRLREGFPATRLRSHTLEKSLRVYRLSFHPRSHPFT